MNISPDDGLINLGHSIMASVCLEMYSDLCKAIDSSWKKKWEKDTQCWSKSYYSVVHFGDCMWLRVYSLNFNFLFCWRHNSRDQWVTEKIAFDWLFPKGSFFFSYKGTEQSKQGVTKWKPYSRMWSQTALIMYVILIYWADSRSMQNLKQAS